MFVRNIIVFISLFFSFLLISECSFAYFEEYCDNCKKKTSSFSYASITELSTDFIQTTAPPPIAIINTSYPILYCSECNNPRELKETVCWSKCTLL